MAYSVKLGNILECEADAIVNCVNSHMVGMSEEADRTLLSAAGAGLKNAMDALGFIAVGSVGVTEGFSLPCAHIIHAVAPRWLTGKAEEFKALHICYRNVFASAEKLGCKTVAMPFLSTGYYRFPWTDAVHIAFAEAEKSCMETLFVTDSKELFELAGKPYVKPRIVSYIGYYRDHALFELDNGLFARVDIRSEVTDVTVIPYYEACYRVGNNPRQAPLAESEIRRLMEVYTENDW